MIDVDRGAFVEALEVERVDGAGLDQGGDQLVVPVVERVELEAQRRVDGEPGQQRLDRGALVGAEAGEPHRADEVDRPRLAAERRGEVGARPGAAPGRAPPTRRPSGGSRARLVALRRRRPGRGRSPSSCSENSAKVPRAGEARGRPGVLLGDVVDGVVDDVLADPLLAAAAQLDRSWSAVRSSPSADLQPLELAGLDLERQVGDRVEAGHRRLPA